MPPHERWRPDRGRSSYRLVHRSGKPERVDSYAQIGGTVQSLVTGPPWGFAG